MEKLKLDAEQKKVINQSGSVICIAGPGSGKTRTLVAKAEQLWTQSEDVICLTFTRSAAQEMRERMHGIPAQTIHAFCKEWVGWKGGYPQLLSDFQEFRWKPKFAWVLVDEVQDLTEVQMNIVLTIAGSNIFAVGDPYQSIYGFNGSMGMQAITQLKARGGTILPLRNNYRSCPKVVAHLNKVYPRNLVSCSTKETGITTILARTNKLVKEASTVLQNLGFKHTVKYGTDIDGDGVLLKDLGDPNLRVMTCHCSKGLEFDYVILYKWGSWIGNEEERNLYYVAASRPSKGLAEVDSAEGLFVALEGRN